MKPYFLFIIILSFISSCTYLPEESDDSLNINRLEVEITENTDFIFIKNKGIPGFFPNHFIFYPGGLVDPHAYIDLLQNLVLINTNVIIVKSDANLAILDQNAAEESIEKILNAVSPDPLTQKQNIILGGHSLGGSVACFLLDDRPELIDGLVLFASYPASSSDLSSYNGRVLSITGSQDQVLNQETYESSKDLLPNGIELNQIIDIPSFIEDNTTIYYEIPGGNHSGFGNYGDQNGDGEREIELSEQYLEIITLIESFYNSSGW